MNTTEGNQVEEKKPIRVLVVEDNPGDAKLVRLALLESHHPFKTKVVECLSAAIERLHNGVFEVVLLDMGLPDSQGIDTVLKVHAESPDTPIVILTILDDEEMGVQAVQIGAQDYLVKRDVTCNLLTRTIRYAIERKQLEQDKEKLQAQLLQAQKLESIGILTGGIAHNFNNILTAIQGYTDLAMMQVDEADPVHRDLKQIRISAVRAAELTRQLLAFSRRQFIKFTPLDLNQTIENLKKMLTGLMGEDTNIETQLGSGLWAIQADEGQIEQIIMNLALNAKNAMFKGGKLTIKTENVRLDESYSKTHNQARPGRFVCLTVQDTGVGMDKEIIRNIFEPFFTTKGMAKATGLGLSVVYGITKQHQGWINVDSKVNQGSVFKIYLPAISGKAKNEVE